VEATCSGTCTNWKLGAALSSTAQTGTTWQIGGRTLSTTVTNFTTTINYNTPTDETFDISVKTNGSSAPENLQQAIVFTATAGGPSAATATATLNSELINSPGISIFFVSDPAGVPLTGGAFNAAVNFGTVQAYGGTLATGVTETQLTSSSYTLATDVDIDVEKSGITSSNYTMQASLATATPAGIQYAVNGVTLTTTAKTVTSTGTYASDEPYTLGLIVSTAGSSAGGPVVGSPLSDTLDFTATAN
jgi:hypothetical protein